MEASVTSQPITATVSGSTVSASVTSLSSSVAASGGVGPQGPPGTNGGPIEQLSNVEIVSAQAGQVLQYDDGKWKNKPMGVNGGNF